MLREVLEAYAPKRREPRPDRTPGISMSSLYPCAHRLRRVHDGVFWDNTLTPQQFYTMDDGWFQEEQSVQRLAKAGVQIIDRQKTVTVGKSNVPGSMDGVVVINGKRRVWEHKAFGSNNFELLTRDLINFPGYKAQVSGYMLGDGSDECVFFVKNRDSNTYWDTIVKLDMDFIGQILEWCDRIRLDDWKPEPVYTSYCQHCRVNCFLEEFNFGSIASASEYDLVEKWKQGKQLSNVGEMMMEEVDTELIGIRGKDGQIIRQGLIGDKDILVLPGMEIRRTISHRFDIDKSAVLEHYGPEGLIKVGRDRDIVSFRHKIV